MPILTLTTDFGLTDHYVAAMKGAMLSLMPTLTLVDVSHEVPPQDIFVAAYLLRQAYSYFPAGTVHLVVVDPGVGTERAALIAQSGSQWFVGADNGLLSLVLEDRPLDALWEIQTEAVTAYHGRAVSATFHGRDVFGPAAALLSRGVPPEDLGRPPVRPWVDYHWARPVVDRRRLIGHVIHIDRYGNLISNIDQPTFDDFSARHPDGVGIWVGRTRLGVPRRTYGSVEEGQPLVLFGSGGLLEVAVHNDRAAELLDARRGTEIWIEPDSVV